MSDVNLYSNSWFWHKDMNQELRYDYKINGVMKYAVLFYNCCRWIVFNPSSAGSVCFIRHPSSLYLQISCLANSKRTSKLCNTGPLCGESTSDWRFPSQKASNVDIKNNAWVTVNNDFWVTSEAICQWFSRVSKSRVKIIGKSHHEWPKNRYSRLRMYYFISYTLFYVLELTILLKTIIDRSFRNCHQGRPFLTSHCDVTTVDLWRHANARY